METPRNEKLSHNRRGNIIFGLTGILTLTAVLSLAVLMVSHESLDHAEAQGAIQRTPTPTPEEEDEDELPPITCTDDTPQAETLIAFFNAMDGNNWTNRTNWNTFSPISTWFGLEFEDNGCVAEMNLESNGLSGTLPDMTGLAGLEDLNLSNNQITGELNPEHLPERLHVLNLSNNQISGAIPEMGDRHLEVLDLSHNQMSGQIHVDHLTSEMITLRLNNNMFSGQFPDLFQLHKKPQEEILTGNTGNTGLSDFSSNSDSTNTRPGTQRHPGAEGLRFLEIVDLSNNRLNGELPDLSAGLITPVEAFANEFARVPNFLREFVVYPGNPGLRGVVISHRLPLNTLKKLVIGDTMDIPDEDPRDPGRLCISFNDLPLRLWLISGDITFQGAYCGGSEAREGGIVITEPTPVDSSTIRVGRIEPRISNIRTRSGDSIILDVNIYGRQGLQDQSLADLVDFEWKEGDRTLEGTGSSIAYPIPSQPGTYTITASLIPGAECHVSLDDHDEDEHDEDEHEHDEDEYGHDEDEHDENEHCTASFVVQVLRSSTAPDSTPEPIDPIGDIPTILVDSDGSQYEVFTPSEGGQFADDVVTLTGSSGAVPNGDVVGLRVDTAGTAQNAGMTHHRYTLAGAAYAVSAVDASGAAISDYRLASALEFCAPLPDKLLGNISDIATLTHNPDDTLTVLSTSIRISGDTLLGCANLSTVPATIAFGTSGAPSPIPSATPEPTPVPPDTGGKSPSSNASLYLLMLIGLAALAIGTYAMHRKSSSV